MAHWYVRPAGGSYGLENGTDYANAWDGFADITWASVQPGDTLFVAGTHHGVVSGSAAFVVGASGTSGSPIVIASCETQYGASTNDAGTIWGGKLITTSGWTGPTNGVYSRSETTMTTGCNVEAGGNVLITTASLAECEAQAGSYWSDSGTLYYHPSGDLADIHFGGLGALDLSGFSTTRSHLTVRGLKLYQAYSGNFGVLTISKEKRGLTCSGITIEDCDIAYGGYHGIFLSGCDVDGVTIKNNTVYDCTAGFYPSILASPGIFEWTNVTVEGNELYHTANITKRGATPDSFGPYYNSPGDECAIAVLGGIDNYTIRDNYIHEWHGEGIFCFLSGFDGAATMHDLTIERNRVFMDSTEAGRLRMGIALGGSNEANFSDRSKRALIANNVIAGCTYSETSVGSNWCCGIRIKSDKPTDPADTARMYNNTINGAYYGVYAVVWSSAVPFGGIIKNNIINEPDTGGYFVYHGNDSDQSGITLDYNCYYGTGKWAWDGAAAQTTLSGWQSASSQDAHSITGDPLLNADYSLQAGSPCIDAGTDTDLTDDFAGNVRPNGGGYDIGAYEYTLVEVVSRPSGDVTTGSWVAVPSGSLYAKLDEATPDDADYIYTRSSASACEMTLSALTPPGGAASYTFSYRGRGLYTVYLKQGAGTTIASWTENDSAYTTHDRTLTPEQTALITDPSTLRVRIVSG